MSQAKEPLVRIPFRRITGLPEQAQIELRRDFEEVIKGIPPASGAGGYVYIACSDATTYEKGLADIKLSGVADDVLINAAIAARPGAKFVFSSGHVRLTAPIALTAGQGIRGCYVPLAGAPFYTPTTFEAGGSNVPYGGPGNPYVFYIPDQGCSIEDVTVTYTVGWAAATAGRIVFNVGAADCQHQTYSRIRTASAFTDLFYVNPLYSCSNAVIDRIETSAAINITFAGAGAITQSNLSNLFMNASATVSQAGIFTSTLVNCNMASTTPINGNGILPVAAPSGPAGGSLAGTYPNPTFAGRDSSVDKINQDLLPALLIPQPGIAQIPAPVGAGGAPSGPAGGSLAGSYPNPTFAGRDSSVDKINQDLLPALLIPQPGLATIPAPGVSGTAVGGSLAGTLPNPTFAGRSSSVDELNKDMTQAFLVMGG